LIDQMDFQNPVPLATESIRIAHRLGIAQVDTRQILVARNLCVSEFADQVPSDRAPKNPSGFRGCGCREGIELSTGRGLSRLVPYIQMGVLAGSRWAPKLLTPRGTTD
jgi:hypothetical protein